MKKITYRAFLYLLLSISEFILEIGVLEAIKFIWGGELIATPLIYIHISILALFMALNIGWALWLTKGKMVFRILCGVFSGYMYQYVFWFPFPHNHHHWMILIIALPATTVCNVVFWELMNKLKIARIEK